MPASLLVLLAGDVGEVREEEAALGGGGRSGVAGDGTFKSFMSAASFCSVALRSATKSAMSASKSLSSSSWRDSDGSRRFICEDATQVQRGLRRSARCVLKQFFS